MTYTINVVLNVGHTDLFNTPSQFHTLQWFKGVFLYQAYNVGDISCPFIFWSGEQNLDWLERVGEWNFPEVNDCLETILSYLEIKPDLK